MGKRCFCSLLFLQYLLALSLVCTEELLLVLKGKANWEIIQSLSCPSPPPKAKYTYNKMLLISMSLSEKDKCWVVISNCLILLPRLRLLARVTRTSSLFGVLWYCSNFLAGELLCFVSEM